MCSTVQHRSTDLSSPVLCCPQREDYCTVSQAQGFPLHRSLLWIQKEKLLSRWRERFVVITEDYLQCYKKGLAQLSQMGDFLFQVP